MCNLVMIVAILKSCDELMKVDEGDRFRKTIICLGELEVK